MAAFNFHRRKTRRWWYVGTTLMVAAFFTVFFVSGAFAVNGSPSGFESADGNMTVEGGPSPPATDWNCFANGGSSNTSGFVTSGINTGTGTCKTGVSGATQVAADQPPSGEITWTKGQKFDTQCPTIATKSTPPKDDFTNVAEFDERDTSGNLFFYGASIRSTANGNSSGDVEFNQNAGTGSSFGCRTLGDRLVAYDFLNGGTSLAFHALAWITCTSSTLPCGTAGKNIGTCLVKTNSPPCWGANVITVSPSEFDGQANQAAIAAGDNGMSGTALVAQQFAEFGVNLTQALGGGALPCFPQQVWESRSSGSSFVSSPEDLEFVHLSTCGSVTIIKHTDPRGLNKSFSYTSNLDSSSGCSQTLTSGGFSLNDSGNSTSDNAANTQNCTTVAVGTTTVNETPVPDGFTFESLSCTDSGGNSTTKNGTTATITVAANGSTTCTYVNQENTATLTTQQSTSTGTVFPGTDVTDTATVTSNGLATATPSGTVTFFLCGPLPSASGCSSSTSPRVSAGTGTLAATATAGQASATSSPAVNTSGSPLDAGIYCFEATWPGDTNYPGAKDVTGPTNECFTVAQIATTVVTTPSPGPNGTTTFGSSVTDSAVITAAQSGGGPITGTVTFFICDPTQVSLLGTCPDPSGTQVSQTSTLTDTTTPGNPPSASATSGSVTVNKTGTWCWRAVYDPGTNHNYTGNSDASSTECFTVQDTTGSTSAQNWLPNDSGTVTAVAGAPLNGTLSIQLYDGSLNCSTGLVSGQEYDKTLTNATSAADTTVTSNNTTYKVSASDSVSWKVTFTSTDPNVTGSSHCESTGLTITN